MLDEVKTAIKDEISVYRQATQQYLKDILPLSFKVLQEHPQWGFHIILHSQMNVIMSMLSLLIDRPGIELPKDMPGIFIRSCKPWELMKDKWGNIPLKEFLKEWDHAYINQFEFKNEEERQWAINQINKKTDTKIEGN